MFGIIGAMAVEIEDLKKNMSIKRTVNISGIEYTCGDLFGVLCVVAVCGVGKVAAAICTQTMILTFSPYAIINIGVAGSGANNIKLLDIVLSDNVVQHDMDTSPLGDPKGMISGIDIINIPADKNLVKLASSSLNELAIKEFHVGTIASGDKFISSKELVKDINSNFGALAVEMEGAAVGHVCYLNHVPFLVIRAISDNANEKASLNYEQFLSLAKDKTHMLIKAMLPKMKEM